MALFEIDNGHLAPARLGREAGDVARLEALDSVRRHVVEVLGRPLFPVCWSADSRTLTTLDASGQVVAVEVVATLDAAAMMAAMAHLADAASTGFVDLAARYPGGLEAFRTEWNEFREAMPARVEPGPRLIVVATRIEEDVRASLGVLMASGVELQEVSVRELASGRRLVDIGRVEPPSVSESGRLLVSRWAARPALDGAGVVTGPQDDAVTAEVEQVTAGPVAGGVVDAAPTVVAGPAPGGAGASPVGAVSSGGGGVPGAASPVAAGGLGGPSVAAPAGGAAGASPEATGPETEAATQALALLGGELGRDTPVVWQALRRGIFHEAVLSVDGVLILADGRRFTDPSVAADAAQGTQGTDGWHVWRFGPRGPRLSEALAEIGTSDR